MKPQRSRPWRGLSNSIQMIEPLESRVLLADVPAGFTDAVIATNLNSPTAMAVAPDGRIFVALQNGTIRVIKDGTLLPTPFATLNNVNSEGERGLLGITFDPDFSTNNYVYVYYTAHNPLRHNVVGRLTASGDVAQGGAVSLVEFPDFGSAIWHMGGALHFGPDAKLYVAVGDHQQPAQAQNLGSVFGKLLRFNSDGTIPVDNPFYAQTTGTNRSIWALGLRNPFTFGIQPGTGRIFINDVGQETFEEINDGAPGANYGWPASEGPNNTGGYTAPFHYYTHLEGCAIAGGVFYNPPVQQFPIDYVGKYFFQDLCGGWIRTIDPATSAVTEFATGNENAVDLDLAPDGSLYYLTRGQGVADGTVGRISYQNTAPQINIQPQDAVAAVGEDVSFSVGASGTGSPSYQWQRRDAEHAEFTDIDGSDSSSYTIDSVRPSDDGASFRAVVTNLHGTATSSAATLTITTNAAPVPLIASPSPGHEFRAGDTINYAGRAFDPEDGTLPESAFTWQVDYYTHGVPRPFIPPISGVTSGSFVIPTNGPYHREDVFYRILLTVEDSGGRTRTVARDIQPVVSSMQLQTNIGGLSLRLDGQPVATPHEFAGVVGFERELGAPLMQTLQDVTYEFVSWSDGGNATHVISTPDENTAYIATYRPVPSVYASDLPWISATNGHGPVERDMSNGELAAGDGGPITIQGVVYAKGLGVHAASDVRFALNGNYTRFLSDVGIDDEVGAGGSVRFQVWGDSTMIYQSPLLRGTDAAVPVDLPLTGVQTLRLVVTNGGDGQAFDHADWAGVRLIRRPLVVMQSDFRWQTAPQALMFRFDSNVQPSLGLDDFNIHNTTSGETIAESVMSLAYDTATNTATITFPGLEAASLPDGNYIATLAAGGIVSAGGNTLPADHLYQFFHLRGDANHDGLVNLGDFNVLAANFGLDERDYTQGDFNYDGTVNLADFNILASRFGTSLFDELQR